MNQRDIIEILDNVSYEQTTQDIDIIIKVYDNELDLIEILLPDSIKFDGYIFTNINLEYLSENEYEMSVKYENKKSDNEHTITFNISKEKAYQYIIKYGFYEVKLLSDHESNPTMLSYQDLYKEIGG